MAMEGMRLNMIALIMGLLIDIQGYFHHIQPIDNSLHQYREYEKNIFCEPI